MLLLLQLPLLLHIYWLLPILAMLLLPLLLQYTIRSCRASMPEPQ